jgi:hypothetical protein
MNPYKQCESKILLTLAIMEVGGQLHNLASFNPYMGPGASLGMVTEGNIPTTVNHYFPQPVINKSTRSSPIILPQERLCLPVPLQLLHTSVLTT